MIWYYVDNVALGLRCFDSIDGKGDFCRQYLNGDKSRYLCGRLSGNKKTNQSGIFSGRFQWCSQEGASLFVCDIGNSSGFLYHKKPSGQDVHLAEVKLAVNGTARARRMRGAHSFFNWGWKSRMGGSKEEEGIENSASEGRILLNGNPFCVVDLYHQ